MSFKSCKGICHKLKGYNPKKRIIQYEQKGYKKCMTCFCHFQVTNGQMRYCLCCGTTLRGVLKEEVLYQYVNFTEADLK